MEFSWYWWIIEVTIGDNLRRDNCNLQYNIKTETELAIGNCSNNADTVKHNQPTTTD
jgi:hypothetical protein